MDINNYKFAYKHPKKTKIHYVNVLAENERDALKQAPNETNKGCIMYGLVSVEFSHKEQPDEL